MLIVSWNIAGGHTVKSTAHFDYDDKEDVSYFAKELKKLDPDVICLQESQTSPKRNLAQTIADSLGKYHVYSVPFSPSHIDPSSRLGNAILTKKPFKDEGSATYPQFKEELYFRNGNKAAVYHDKGMLRLTYEGVQIANTHLLSLVTFNRSYEEPAGVELAKAVNDTIERLTAPLILCGDFAMESGQDQVLASALKKLQLKNALPKANTYHRPAMTGTAVNAPDCIYFSSDLLEVTDAGIVKTDTDHYLTWADIS